MPRGPQIQVDIKADGLTDIVFASGIPAPLPDSVYLRLRIVDGACASLGPSGMVIGGEIEDRVLSFQPTAVDVRAFRTSATVVSVPGIGGLTTALLAVGAAWVWRRRR